MLASNCTIQEIFLGGNEIGNEGINALNHLLLSNQSIQKVYYVKCNFVYFLKILNNSFISFKKSKFNRNSRIYRKKT